MHKLRLVCGMFDVVQYDGNNVINKLTNIKMHVCIEKI